MHILKMIKNQLKLLFNNRIALFAIIAAPLLLSFLFSFSTGSSKTNLYLCDNDNSVYSRQLVKMLKSNDDLKLVSISKQDMNSKLKDNTIPVCFEISKNFEEDLRSGKSLDIKAYENYQTSDGALLEQAVLADADSLKKITADSKTITDNLKLTNDNFSKEMLKEINTSSKISVSDDSSQSIKNNQSSVTTTFIGFLVMFLWFVIVQGFRTFIEEKQNGTISRILSTPVNYRKYVFSKIIAAYILGLIIIAVTIIAAKYFLNISLAANIIDEVVILAVYLFAITGIVMIFVPFIKRQQSFTMLGGIIMAITGILGGSFFSIDEVAPGPMKIIAKFMPESWAIKSINSITLNGSSLSAQSMSLLALTAMGVVGFIIAYILLETKNKKVIGA